MRPHRLSLSTSFGRALGTRARPVTVAIRAEHPARRWERRVPLTPSAVAELIETTGARVLVAPSSKRCYPDAAYARAGAVITPDLDADYVLGVKEPQMHELERTARPRAHLSFFHCHKGESGLRCAC